MIFLLLNNRICSWNHCRNNPHIWLIRHCNIDDTFYSVLCRWNTFGMISIEYNYSRAIFNQWLSFPNQQCLKQKEFHFKLFLYSVKILNFASIYHRTCDYFTSRNSLFNIWTSTFEELINLRRTISKSQNLFSIRKAPNCLRSL